tara:strand:+ start:3776 stop:4159 length:384 start_codon:yes stop_codon:yes gene_type:complete
MKHVARIINNQIVFTDKYKLDNYLKSFEGDSVVVSITNNKPRSINLNKYYWGVVVALSSKELGYEKEEMHSTFKEKFLYKKELVEGEWIKIIKSTTKISSKEMITYIDQIKRFCVEELGIYIPDPHE